MILNTTIQNVPELTWLELHLSDQKLDPIPPLEAENMSATLLSNEFRNLRTLELMRMKMHASDLVQALSRCTLLEKLVLHRFQLAEAWSGPLRQMLALPKLSCIEIQELRSANGAEDGKYLLLKLDRLQCWPKWGDDDGWGQHGIRINDRAVVQASLRELVSRPLLYDLIWIGMIGDHWRGCTHSAFSHRSAHICFGSPFIAKGQMDDTRVKLERLDEAVVC